MTRPRTTRIHRVPVAAPVVAALAASLIGMSPTPAAAHALPGGEVPELLDPDADLDGWFCDEDDCEEQVEICEDEVLGDEGFGECLTPYSLPGWWWCAPAGTVACGGGADVDMSQQAICFNPCVLNVTIDACLVTNHPCARADGAVGVEVWVDGLMECS